MSYKVLSNIRHNDVNYETGQTVSEAEIDAEAAKVLIEAGALAEQAAETAAKTQTDATTEPSAQTSEETNPPQADTSEAASTAPLGGDQPSTASSTEANDVPPPLNEQVDSNVSADLQDSQDLAEQAAKPASPQQPTDDEIAETAANA